MTVSDPISVAQNLAPLHTERPPGDQGAACFPMLAQLLIHHQFSWWLAFSCGETEAGQPLTPGLPECSRQGKVPMRKGIPEWLSAAIHTCLQPKCNPLYLGFQQCLGWKWFQTHFISAARHPQSCSCTQPPSHRAGRLQLKAPLLPWDVFYSVRSYCKSSSMGQRRIRPQGNVRSSPGSSFAFRLSSAAQCSDQEQLSSQPQSTLQMKANAPLQAGKLRHSFKEE